MAPPLDALSVAACPRLALTARVVGLTSAVVMPAALAQIMAMSLPTGHASNITDVAWTLVDMLVPADHVSGSELVSHRNASSLAVAVESAKITIVLPFATARTLT